MVSGLKLAPAVPASPGPVAAPTREQTRARYPDETGFVERDGVRVFWERYGDGSPTILLMPTWSVVHSRHWKVQIPYLARQFRVVTFDGRGNGRSDRPPTRRPTPTRSSPPTPPRCWTRRGTERAVVAGLSMGAGYGIRLAVDYPDRMLGLVLFGGVDPGLATGEPGEATGPDAVVRGTPARR